jgi:hypothetical protein
MIRRLLEVGVVVARTLVELGHSPADAIELVRRQRGLSVDGLKHSRTKASWPGCSASRGPRASSTRGFCPRPGCSRGPHQPEEEDELKGRPEG